MNRRQFLQTAAGAAALLAVREKAYGYAVSPRIRKFITPIRSFGSYGPFAASQEIIPLATKNTAKYPGIDYYDIEIGVFRDHLHPDLPNGTRLYGYFDRGSALPMHLGGAIVATKDRPVRMSFTCNLPSPHILPFDPTIPQGPMGTTPRQDAAAVHLHGGLVPWTSDGGPFHWTAASGEEGASLPLGGWLDDDADATTNDYFYPNHQSARFMWYHDHAVGITRTNAYAGGATGYFIIDSTETGLGIPVPGDILVFQDKVFWDPLIDPGYATCGVNTSDAGGLAAGDLWYPYIYDRKVWKLIKGLPIVGASCVAEMFGDTMLVNGTPYPNMPANGMHRLRMLNACNSRFLNLSFAAEHPQKPGEVQVNNKWVPVLAPVSVWQIGTEGGFLPAPVPLVLNGVAQPGVQLLLAPAERVDLIVDFSAAAGMNVILYNNAPAPYPGGSPLFDFATEVGTAKPGLGPNTRTILRFQVGAATNTFNMPNLAGASPLLPTVADNVNGGLAIDVASLANAGFGGYQYLDPTVAGNTQEITLNEAFDQYGRLAQLIGNVNNANGLFGSPYWDGPGEQVQYGKIQIWNVYNLTADAHPMHVHLFNAMILRRRPFKVNQFNGVPVFTALGRGPDPNELGWKETFKMYPGECTTLAVLVEDPFVLPDPGTGVHGSDSTARTYTFNVAGAAAPVTTEPLIYSPRLATFGVTGDEYVWHCHILEHEEHDMMHSLVAI